MPIAVVTASSLASSFGSIIADNKQEGRKGNDRRVCGKARETKEHTKGTDGCDNRELTNQTSVDDVFMGVAQSRSCSFFLLSSVYELRAKRSSTIFNSRYLQCY